MKRLRRLRTFPPIAASVAALTSVAFNYYETKRDRNRAKRERKAV